ncbi:MAG: tetratricopeptide repeat protein [Deltaproteobacteria bacterium]|nr:tetratricopeptide repeat protein [Deltaproteobacteria bacterium]
MKTIPVTAALLLLSVSCSPGAAESVDIKKSEYHYKLGTNCYMDKDVSCAISELYRSIELNPRYAEAHHMLGFVYMGRRQFPEALKHMNLAVELNPKLLEARANLGALMLAMEDWDMAVEILMPLTQEPLYPTPYLVHNNIGWAYFNMKKHALAEKYLKMAVFLNPKMCLAYNNLAMVHEARRQPEDALQAFREAAKLCPDYQEPWFRQGVLLQNLSRADEARTALEKCVKLGEDSHMGRRCKGRLQ